MTNIMCLCDIFNCKINESIHEDMTDIDSLDKEIKMSVVNFKKDEQRKMKGISKFIYIISKIGNIISKVALVLFLLISLMFIFIVYFGKVDTSNNNMIFLGKEVNYKLNENELSFGNDNKIILASDFTQDEIDNINYAFNLSKPTQISIVLLLSISIIISIYAIVKLIDNLEKLFKNIYNFDTPFNMDNVLYIRRLAIYTLIAFVIPDLLGSIAELISLINFNVKIELGKYIVIAIIFAISYVFKYGYEIQLNSKGKIYGDTNE